MASNNNNNNNTTTPFDAPIDLKPLFPYLQRAIEVQDRDSAVSYWCKMHVAQQAIALTRSLPSVRGWLMAFVDSLEQEKMRLKGTCEAVSDMLVAYAHVESFALACFSSADNEDCAGQATLRTAKVYLAASHYIDVVIGNFLSNDDDAVASLREKAKYAKWRATEIIKAQKLGVKVALPPHAPAHVSSNSNSNTANADNDGVPLSPSQEQQQQQHHHHHYQQQQPPLPSLQPQPPATTTIQPPTVPSYTYLQPQSSESQSQYKQHDSRSSGSSSLPAGARAALGIDARLAATVTKNAKFAISALEHDDVPTAITNLRTALELLENAYSINK